MRPAALQLSMTPPVLLASHLKNIRGCYGFMKADNLTLDFTITKLAQFPGKASVFCRICQSHHCRCLHPAAWCPSSGWTSTPAGWGDRCGQRELGAAEMSAVCVGTVSNTPLDRGQTHTWRRSTESCSGRKMFFQTGYSKSHYRLVVDIHTLPIVIPSFSENP